MWWLARGPAAVAGGRRPELLLEALEALEAQEALQLEVEAQEEEAQAQGEHGGQRLCREAHMGCSPEHPV